MKKTLFFLIAVLMLSMTACGINANVSTDIDSDSIVGGLTTDNNNGSPMDTDGIINQGTDTDGITDSDGVVGTFSTELFD